MIHQLRQKLTNLAFLAKQRQRSLLFRSTNYSFFSNINNQKNESLLNAKVDFKSLTKIEIADYLRKLNQECTMTDKNKQVLANKLNNIEQQAANHISLNQDDLTSLILILQIMFQNQRQSQNILNLAHTVLLNYFSKQMNMQNTSAQKFMESLHVFQQIVPLIAKSDKFEYELVQKLHLFFSQDQVLNQFTQTSLLHLIKFFFSKGIIEIPLKININPESLPFQELVEYIWMTSLSGAQITQDQTKILCKFLQEQPSIKNIPKAIQYKLKEISISSDLGEASKYISQFDHFYTQESQVSPIQEDCEIILKVLKWNFKSEVRIDPYTVDFLITLPSIKNQIVLEMNGPSHYPYFSNKDVFSAKEQMKVKNLKIKNYIPVLIHHQDWSQIKGVTGKIDFIQNLVQKHIKQTNL
ncbi:RAP domain protein (macronuclear) [Tetrahymena thermophila SB210]|uniref:RAP domain protein n=1 Tax=Tetrahymena thermophila (strain SB210) TaxID=312017 RepID=I7MDN0_TETTS|nr:RAP domain protein [Tetrahymena thermophila SB210]EAR89918.2 RAP domain protein [Tetrahymena thermophila SB210]|eukprot:XP_001010163.2 RAP domain protein [Tetrahymena thermophila SB210]